jgi:hypothetical protein
LCGSFGKRSETKNSFFCICSGEKRANQPYSIADNPVKNVGIVIFVIYIFSKNDKTKKEQ